jgi:transposase
MAETRPSGSVFGQFETRSLTVAFLPLMHNFVNGISQCRRLSKDYKELPETSETIVHIAMIRLMLKRLA